MAELSVTLSKADADRLAELAAREGASPEDVAAAAVRARLDAETAAHAEIDAGFAELDAGGGINFDAYERELDAFMADMKKRA